MYHLGFEILEPRVLDEANALTEEWRLSIANRDGRQVTWSTEGVVTDVPADPLGDRAQNTAEAELQQNCPEASWLFAPGHRVTMCRSCDIV